ncbi:hypothetical protein MC885_020155, partial [Smutsia gigantea]
RKAVAENFSRGGAGRGPGARGPGRPFGVALFVELNCPLARVPCKWIRGKRSCNYVLVAGGDGRSSNSRILMNSSRHLRTLYANSEK